jgi:hypothetical protein
MRRRRHRPPGTVTQATPRLGQALALVAVPEPDPNRTASALVGVDSCGSQEDRLPSAASALAASTRLTLLAGRWRR